MVWMSVSERDQHGERQQPFPGNAMDCPNTHHMKYAMLKGVSRGIGNVCWRKTYNVIDYAMDPFVTKILILGKVAAGQSMGICFIT